MDPDISKTAVDLRKAADFTLESLRNFCVKTLDPQNVTEENSKFCQVVLALCTAAESNYEKLRESYDKADYVSLALSCRNLLEVAIFTQFVLQSKANADEFAADRLIDTADIAISLKSLVSQLQPSGDVADLDEAIRLCHKQVAEEGVSRDKYLRTSQLATKLNMRAEYDSMNTLCSKFVHPTSWSLFNLSEVATQFPIARELLFSVGAKYLAMVYAEVRPHITKYGLQHKA
jgi:hypothetical protein